MADDFRINIESQVDLSKAKSDIDKFLSSYKNDKLKISVAFDTKNNELSKIQKEINQLKSHPIDIKVKTSGLNNLKKTQNDFKILKNLANEIGQKKVKIASLDSNKNSNQIKELSSQLRKLQSDYDVLYSSFSKNLSTSQIGQLNNILGKSSDRVAELNAKTKDLSENMSKATKPFNQLDAVTAGNKTLNWLNENTKAAKEYGEVLEDLAQKQKSATNAEELANYNKQVKSIISDAQVKGLAGKSAIDEIGRALKQIGEFTSIYGLLQNVIYEVPQQMVQAVKDIDNSMVNLQMATGVSNSEAKELMNTYMQMGKELKATATDVATSATEWLKQGKTIKEANNLAKDSIVLSKIGDLSSEDSTKTITAAMKSYDLQESEIMNFIDKISAIDMASATDVGGLANAFNKVAANARQAGVESEKVLAYAATIGETTQAGMDSVGTSLNAIFSRMGNIKLSRLKDPESGEDLSNVETSLRNVGIELRESTGEFRDFDNVLDETANRWDSFSEVTQRSIASSFAGTHHLNDFMVLMQNYSQAEKYIETANNSSGESLKKYEAYQNSIQGKTEKLKATFQELSTTIVNSDLFKGLIDGGTNVINIITQIIDKVGILTPLIAGFATKNGLGKRNATLYKVKQNNRRFINVESFIA